MAERDINGPKGIGDFPPFLFDRRRYILGKKPRTKERMNHGKTFGKPRVKPIKNEYLKSPPPIPPFEIIIIRAGISCFCPVR